MTYNQIRARLIEQGLSFRQFALAHGYDKLIRDVLEHIKDEFPAHLNLKDQGLFALGFYHQRAEKAVKQDEDNSQPSQTNQAN